MTSVPYLYVNLIALCCYIVMMSAFVSAKKTSENKAFIFVLTGFIVWTASSILMRLRVEPGMDFWFYASLLGLFAIPLLLYFFISTFAGVHEPVARIVWIAGTCVMMTCAAFGLFLLPPEVVAGPAGAYFTYSVTWTVAIPLAFFVAMFISIIRIIVNLVRENGLHMPGINGIIFGCIALAVGNMAQLIPGNVFPYDMLSGIVFAVGLLYALIKKRVFHLELFASGTVLRIASLSACIVLAMYAATPVEQYVGSMRDITPVSATVLIVIFFFIVYMGIYELLKALFAPFFIKREQQNKAIGEYSKKVSTLVSSEDIVGELCVAIRAGLGVEKTYAFVLARRHYDYVPTNADDGENPLGFRLDAGSGLVNYFNEGEPHFITDELRTSGLYHTLAPEDHMLLHMLSVECAVALRNDHGLVGVIMTTGKKGNKGIGTTDIDFLMTLCSIAAIAFDNVSLYEQLFREARIDSLTGVYNYSYFVERLNEDYYKYDKNIALVYLDIDDMKLYNQLYGVNKGDYMLKEVARIICETAEPKGTVFRHSGKTFAILLLEYEAKDAYALAEEVQSKLTALGSGTTDGHRRTITVSGGICASPEAATSPSVLSEHADIAVFNAKTSDKGILRIYSTITEGSKEISERVKHIIEASENKGDSRYAVYSSTIMALTAAIDAKDHYTYTHSQSVAYYASTLAVASGLSDDEVRLVYDAALLHDIGKISIPESILGKTSALTDEERVIINSHVDNSIEIIRHLPSMDYVIPAAISHHERWDGKGYPRGLKGDEIPVSGRCLAIADAFDAMTSDRPYRSGRSLDFAISEMESNKGKQFDPWLVGIFLELIYDGEVTISATRGGAV